MLSQEYTKFYVSILIPMDILGCFLCFSIKQYFGEILIYVHLHKCLALCFIYIWKNLSGWGRRKGKEERDGKGS